MVKPHYFVRMAGTSKHAQNIADTLVSELAKERLKQGYSQRKLAQMAGISQAGLLFIEKGERRPTLEILLQIAEALDVDLSRLLAESQKKNRR